MREIKFRAWHKKDGWCGAFSVHQTGLVRTGDSEPIWQTPEEAQMILMQFTGLHDKNGKEIWEGDIVRFSNEALMSEGEFEMGSIGFLNGAFVILDAKGNPISQMKDGWKDHWYSIEQYRYRSQDGGIEVLGNIYETPELLK